MPIYLIVDLLFILASLYSGCGCCCTVKPIAAVSCSPDVALLGGVDRCIFVTGKPRRAWVGAWVHGMVGLHWGVFITPVKSFSKVGHYALRRASNFMKSTPRRLFKFY